MFEQMKVKELIQLLPYDQLVKLFNDLSSGGHHLHRLVKQRIHELETTDKKICAQCGIEIKEIAAPFTLTFGPITFRKKATFCASDCLLAFHNHLQQIKSKHD